MRGICCISLLLMMPFAIDTEKLNEEQKKELKRFVGVWEYQSVIREGKVREAKWLEDLTMEFAENGCFMVKHKNGVVALGRIIVDPSKSPKQLSLSVSTRSEYDGKLRGVTEVIGIYEIEKTKLRICFNTEASKKPRPTQFSSKENEETVLEELKPYEWKSAPTSPKK